MTALEAAALDDDGDDDDDGDGDDAGGKRGKT